MEEEATHLCWTCQKNNNQIHRSANFSEAEKVEAVRAQKEHLRLASGKGEHDKNCCKESKAPVECHLEEVDFAFGREPCSDNRTVYYSYDYGQRLHYPANSMISYVHYFF